MFSDSERRTLKDTDRANLFFLVASGRDVQS
jgi:hypothetical protein